MCRPACFYWYGVAGQRRQVSLVVFEGGENFHDECDVKFSHECGGKFFIWGDFLKNRKEKQPALMGAAAGESGKGRQGLGTSCQVIIWIWIRICSCEFG